MSWLWHRPATGSSCIRRCAAGRRDGVAKKIAEQSILTTPAWLSHIVERAPLRFIFLGDQEWTFRLLSNLPAFLQSRGLPAPDREIE